MVAWAWWIFIFLFFNQIICWQLLVLLADHSNLICWNRAWSPTVFTHDVFTAEFGRNTFSSWDVRVALILIVPTNAASSRHTRDSIIVIAMLAWLTFATSRSLALTGTRHKSVNIVVGFCYLVMNCHVLGKRELHRLLLWLLAHPRAFANGCLSFKIFLIQMVHIRHHADLVE